MGVIITARRDGFRRGGIAHSAAGTFYPDGALTEEQLQAFREDPQLVVIEQVKQLSDVGHRAPLMEEMGNTIASLEYSLEIANDQYDAASVLLTALREQQLGASVLIVTEARALEPADPNAEGVICIAADVLLSLISKHLQPVQASPEAPDESDSTSNGPASGAEAPPNPATATPVSPAPGSDADVVKGAKATGKRGSGKEADK